MSNLLYGQLSSTADWRRAQGGQSVNLAKPKRPAHIQCAVGEASDATLVLVAVSHAHCGRVVDCHVILKCL